MGTFTDAVGEAGAQAVGGGSGLGVGGTLGGFGAGVSKGIGSSVGRGKSTGAGDKGASNAPPPGKKIFIDPVTAAPVGQVPAGQLTIGGPARASTPYTNVAETMAQQNPTQTPAGSQELANAINSQGFYEHASRQYNAPGLNGFMLRNAGLLGLGYEQPDLSRPQTYAEGAPQIGINPGGLAGGLASLGTGIPGLGTLLGQAWRLTGQPDPILTGGPSYDPQTGQLAKPPAAPPSSQIAGRSTGAGTSGGAEALPSATPGATMSSTASQPVQSSPTAAQSASSGSGPGFQALGQRSQGGGTIISGGNTVAWPWNTIG